MGNVCLNSHISDTSMHRLKGVGWGTLGSLSAVVTVALAVLTVGIALGGVAGGGYFIYHVAATQASLIPVAILIVIPKVALCGFLAYGIASPTMGMLGITSTCFGKAKAHLVSN